LKEFTGEHTDRRAKGTYPIHNDIDEVELFFVVVVQYPAQSTELTAGDLPARILIQIAQAN
jgi:hypothetical protein